MNLIQLSNYSKESKSFVGLDSENLESLKQNDESNPGDPHIGLMGYLHSIIFYNFKKIDSILNRIHFSKRLNPFTQSSNRKICETNSGQKNTKFIVPVGRKISTGIISSFSDNTKYDLKSNLSVLQHSSKRKFTISEMRNLKNSVKQNLGETKIRLIGDKIPIILFYLKIKKLEAKVCRPLQVTKLITNWSYCL